MDKNVSRSNSLTRRSKLPQIDIQALVKDKSLEQKKGYIESLKSQSVLKGSLINKILNYKSKGVIGFQAIKEEDVAGRI